MDSHRQIRRLPLRRLNIGICACIVLVINIPVTGMARRGRAGSSAAYPSHAQFVRDGLEHAADVLFCEFSFQRGKPLVVAADDSSASNPWFAAAAARQMYEHGMLVRAPAGTDSLGGAGSWILRYRFGQYHLELSDPQRRSFLGKIWLRRSFHVGLSVGLWDTDAGELLWLNSIDTTWEDWIPKRDLRALADPEDPFLSPPAPVTVWQHNSAPVAAIMAGTALAAAFLLLR